MAKDLEKDLDQRGQGRGFRQMDMIKGSESEDLVKGAGPGPKGLEQRVKTRGSRKGTGPKELKMD